MKKMLLASTSTIYGQKYLDYLQDEIKNLFSKSKNILFIPFARPSGITHLEYTEKVKRKLGSLSNSSKQWWGINRTLLYKKGKLTSLPTLKFQGEWLTNPKEKANAFAKTFESKSKLPPEIIDTPFVGDSENEALHWIPFRSRSCRRFFRKLNKNKATGNDMISAEILKVLADELCIPFTKVCRRLFYEGH